MQTTENDDRRPEGPSGWPAWPDQLRHHDHGRAHPAETHARLAADRRRLLMAVDALLFLFGILLVVAVAIECFGAYFSLDGTTPTPTAGEQTLWAITALTAIAVSLAAFIVALVIGKTWRVVFGILGVIGIGLTLAATVIFAVPQGRFDSIRYGTSTSHSTELPRDYNPCYSGSNTCN